MYTRYFQFPRQCPAVTHPSIQAGLGLRAHLRGGRGQQPLPELRHGVAAADRHVASTRPGQGSEDGKIPGKLPGNCWENHGTYWNIYV